MMEITKEDIIEWLQMAIEDVRSAEFVEGSFDKEYVMKKQYSEHPWQNRVEPTDERILTVRYRKRKEKAEAQHGL